MKYQFTRISSNAKTGPIPTTMTEKDSCPDTCPLKLSGCYAENFPLSLHWGKVSETGISASKLASNLKALPIGQLWRHNVAGDLPHDNGVIDLKELEPIMQAVERRKLETILYTHHQLKKNIKQLEQVKRRGINVNLSCNSVSEAIAAVQAGFNAVTLMPSSAPKVTKLDGAKVVICPAQTSERVTCASCGLCAKDRGNTIIGFYPHGARSKKAETTIRG